MPGGDKSGPMGQGSRTGRGMGNCPPAEGTTPANEPTFGRGMGRGAGRGLGRGMGRGMGRGAGRNNPQTGNNA